MQQCKKRKSCNLLDDIYDITPMGKLPNGETLKPA